MTSLADAGVLESITLLARREASSRELVEACLDRIRERDGRQSHDGDPRSVNAWVRVYRDDALAAADRADARLAAGESPELCGVPVGLKDLYALPASRSRRRAVCSTMCRPSRARPGCGSSRPGWCCSVTCIRMSSLRAERPIRLATRGRSTARRADRAAAPRPRWRREWSRRQRARTPPGRCASRPPSAARRRSSPRGERCRHAASFRSRPPSTTPGRWREPSRTASRCSLR